MDNRMRNVVSALLQQPFKQEWIWVRREGCPLGLGLADSKVTQTVSDRVLLNFTPRK